MRSLGVALLPLLSLTITGCIHIVPVGRIGEVTEAKRLYKTLKGFAPESRDLLVQEHDVANALKIALDEAPQLSKETLRDKFNSYSDRFIAIRNRRQQILEAIRQGMWDSPMVFVVQQRAMAGVQDDIARTETWIKFAQNIRLRTELGRDKDFPEFAALSHQLEGFLSLSVIDPLSIQLRALQEEFRFNEGEAG